MSRVEDDQRKTQDAERLQQKIEREARDAKTGQAGRDAFSKLVKGNQQTSADAKAKSAKAQTDAKQSQQKGGSVAKEQQAQNQKTKSARGSVQTQSKAMEQARSFQGVLSNAQSTTGQENKGRIERRDDGKAKDRVERDDREVDVKRVETKKDVDAEIQRVEAREQARPNSAIDTNAGDTGGDQRGDDRNAGVGAMKANTVQQAQQASAAHEVKQISPELLDKLVSAVYLGVNDKGLKEFQIELKDGPLKGASMRISAEDGKVSLRFDGLDGNTKRLIEASKGELMRRLSGKGLSLSKLEVR
jgi:hypothetical protein